MVVFAGVGRIGVVHRPDIVNEVFGLVVTQESVDIVCIESIVVEQILVELEREIGHQAEALPTGTYAEATRPVGVQILPRCLCQRHTIV